MLHEGQVLVPAVRVSLFVGEQAEAEADGVVAVLYRPVHVGLERRALLRAHSSSL